MKNLSEYEADLLVQNAAKEPIFEENDMVIVINDKDPLYNQICTVVMQEDNLVYINFDGTNSFFWFGKSEIKHVKNESVHAEKPKPYMAQPYQPFKKGDFAKGLADFFTPGIKIPVRLTKRRARIIQDIIRENKYKTYLMEEKHGEQYAEDWCAVMQWMANEIYKRWSPAELTQK